MRILCVAASLLCSCADCIRLRGGVSNSDSGKWLYFIHWTKVSDYRSIAGNWKCNAVRNAHVHKHIVQRVGGKYPDCRPRASE